MREKVSSIESIPFWAECTGSLRTSSESGRSTTRRARGKRWRKWRDLCPSEHDSWLEPRCNVKYDDTLTQTEQNYAHSSVDVLCGSQSWWSCCHWCRSCSRATSPRNKVCQLLNSHFCTSTSIVHLLSDCMLWSSILSCSHLLHTFAPRKRVIWGVVFEKVERSSGNGQDGNIGTWTLLLDDNALWRHVLEDVCMPW